MPKNPVAGGVVAGVRSGGVGGIEGRHILECTPWGIKGTQSLSPRPRGGLVLDHLEQDAGGLGVKSGALPLSAVEMVSAFEGERRDGARDRDRAENLGDTYLFS